MRERPGEGHNRKERKMTREEKIVVYGTESETWVKTRKGLFLVQSPDLQGEFEDHTAYGLPENAVELSAQIAADLEIPEDLW
jgi:hypothetical protein